MKQYRFQRWSAREMLVLRKARRKRFKPVWLLKRNSKMRKPQGIHLALGRAFKLRLFGSLFDPHCPF